MIDALIQRIARRANAGFVTFDEIVERHSVDATVLHMGCGSGKVATEEIAGLALGVVGIDPVEGKIRDARRKAREAGIENADFLCRPLHATGMAGSSFDMIFGVCLIERGGEPIVKEAKRLLRPNGIFMTCEVNLGGGMSEAFWRSFPTGEVERFGIVTRVSIFTGAKGYGAA